MKKLLTLFLIIFFLAGLIFTVPAQKPAKADLVQPTVVSISMNSVPVDPTQVVDMSAYTSEFPMWKPENGLFANGWIIMNQSIPVGTEFQVVLDTKMQEPQMAVMQGDLVSWSYDATTGYTTINTKSIIIPGQHGGPDVNGLITAVVLTLPAGSPAEVKGVYISTNASNWDIIPPTDKKNPKFGFIITGKDGYENGFFKMYMPKALLDMMGVTPEQMGVFVDGTQMSVDVSATADGGAMISITLHYSTRRVEAGKALPLSLTASKTKVKKGGKVTLSGWLGTKEEGKDITIYKKEKGKTSYEAVTTVTTKTDGYFSKTFTLEKNASFKALYKKIKKGKAVKKTWSKVVTVKVKK